MENELHPLTARLISSGIQFNEQISVKNGFDAYALSPDAKAFAVSMDREGQVHAWGKA